MVFSSTIFLFLFLPLVLVSYLLAGRRLRNTILLFASIFFYIWGENIFVLVMLLSISINYVFGVLIDRSLKNGKNGKLPLVLGVLANISILLFFKYANFIIDNVNVLLINLNINEIELDDIHLPIGISFFTFQALSYIIDIYRKEAKVQNNLLNLGLYISLFPQLIAGPIVRYNDIAEQINYRKSLLSDFASGSERFIYGLGKKVLIANPLAEIADQIFSLPSDQLSTGTAWVGLVCYTLQIYFDFSGYSDMAIGLGRMFGFKFLENFNYPYISTSIREFWRRWHISLSTWFRDYLYIPLGGNRHSVNRTRVNLLIVFILCGLWHGASWNFIIWGLIHGFFLVLERGIFGRLLETIPKALQLGYVLFVVMNAWVFFRADELSNAIEYLSAMYGGATLNSLYPFVVQNINGALLASFAAGIILSAPVYSVLRHQILQTINVHSINENIIIIIYAFKYVLIMAIFILSISSLAVGSYNPFIYFRF